MFKLLVKLFVKNSEDLNDPNVRKSYAVVSSAYAMVLNFILFGAKFFAGIMSGSVAITADAFHTLSDAASAIISYIGFKLAGRKPDKKHPFGHGRIEYITGFIISAVILIMGVELGISSIDKIRNPESVEMGLVPIIIEVAAILVKLYMYLYNHKAAKKISSPTLQAMARDSLSDCLSTIVVIISLAIALIFHVNIDGWSGVVVCLFIIYAGIKSAIETLSPLLGLAPSPELVKNIKNTVMEYPEIEGIHDLIVHDYGPGRLYISLHAEVDGKGDIFALHDAIDCAEKDLQNNYNCIATIHMDPIESDNENVEKLKKEITEKIRELYPNASIHDFRMVPGTTHTNLIFDTVLPMEEKDSDDKAKDKIVEKISNEYENYVGVIHIDRDYT